MYVRIYVQLKWTFPRRTCPNSVSGSIPSQIVPDAGDEERCQTEKRLNPGLELQLVGDSWIVLAKIVSLSEASLVLRGPI